MYPPKETPKPSQLDGPQVSCLIDRLIQNRIAQHILAAHAIKDVGPEVMHSLDEECELCKRDLTDYLLATDPRKGIYAKGPND